MSLTMRQFRDAVVDNRPINGVSKGVLLSSAGGVLPPEAHREFMDKLVDGSAFFQSINVLTVTRPAYELHHLVMAARQMRAANPGTAIATGTITPVERTLNPTAGLVVMDVSYDWLADNADERDANAVLNEKLAKYTQGELLDLAGNGDGSTGSFLSINSGFPALLAADSDSDVKTYDATNTTMTSVFAAMRDAQTDTQYRDGGVIYCSVSEFDSFIDSLGSRATLLGDNILQAGGPAPWQGYKVIGIPKWPNDKVIFTPAWNLCMGVWHQIKISVRDIPEMDIIRIVLRTRFDFNYAVGAAAVYGTTD